MDDQSGKVIDGTARARHWRRSRTETRGEDRETEVRSDAPKGFAASLLVPADMLDGVPPDIADVSTAATGSAQHGTSEEDGRRAEDASAAAPDHRNPFLMPEAEAAVIRAPAKRRFGRLTTRAVITRRIAWPALLTRPLAGRPRATRRGLLAVVAVSAGAAVITDIAVHAGAPSRSEPTQSTTERRSNRLTRPARRSLAADQAAPSPAIAEPSIEGPHQPRPPTAQSSDTRFAGHRGCGSLHDTADSN